MWSCSAIVLAGGRATRLGGANKALLDIGGRPVLSWVLDALRPLSDQILVVGHLARGLHAPGVEVIADAFPEGSALVAVYSGLLVARHDVSVVVGCDMPFLCTPLLQRVAELCEGYDVAVPRIGPHLEALHAAYRRSCLPTIESEIRRRQHKIIDFYPLVNVREVQESELRELNPDLHSFLNVNTPADLERARALVTLR